MKCLLTMVTMLMISNTDLALGYEGETCTETVITRTGDGEVVSTTYSGTFTEDPMTGESNCEYGTRQTVECSIPLPPRVYRFEDEISGEVYCEKNLAPKLDYRGGVKNT